MGVAPPGPFPRQVRVALLRRAPRGANACVHVAAKEKFVAWVAASAGTRRASDCAFQLDLRCADNFRAHCSSGFAWRCWFFLNRSFSGRVFAVLCETASGIRVVRSFGFCLRLGLDESFGLPVTCPMEAFLQFPQPCEFHPALFLLFFLQMNYLSAPQFVPLYGFQGESLRNFADLPPQLCVPSPQLCGPCGHPPDCQGALLAGASSPSKSARSRRPALLRWLCRRSAATSSSNVRVFAG